jgi:hypothetical protein
MSLTAWIAIVAALAVIVLIVVAILFWPKDGSF